MVLVDEFSEGFLVVSGLVLLINPIIIIIVAIYSEGYLVVCLLSAKEQMIVSSWTKD